MKFTCDRAGLLSICQTLHAAVDPAAAKTRPVLACVKIESSGEGITLMATDLEVGVRYRIPGFGGCVTVGRNGACAIPIGQLLSILREHDDDVVTVNAGDEDTVVTVGTSRFKLATMDGDTFPAVAPVIDPATANEVSPDALRRVIRRTAFAVERRETTKYALTGVLWEFDAAGVIRLVAFDGYRVAVARGVAAVVSPTDPKAQHLVPPKAMKLIEKCIGGADDLVRVTLLNGSMCVSSGNWAVETKLIAGKFPPVQKLFGKPRAVRLLIDPVEFSAKVRRASITMDEVSRRVEFGFVPGSVEMQSSGSETGVGTVEMGLPDFTGPEIELAFDPGTITDVLRLADGEPVVLEMTDNMTSVVFRVGADFDYLVNPMIAKAKN